MADTTNPPHPLLPPISTSIPPVVDSDEPILPSSSISTTSTRIDTPSSLSNAATHEPKRADGAAEKEGQSNEELPSVLVVDVEHFPVEDDPRLWSRRRKNMVLGIVAFTAMGGTISANIFFPALASLQSDFQTSNELVAASVSLFILGQGVFPMCWSGISEIKGRKSSYITSLIIYCAASAVCARAQSIGVFIGFRIVQSAGSSAVLALGAGTLADIYDVHERGTRLGIYYGVPLLGPSLGPLVGGALTSISSWRSTFYFLLGYGALCLLLMIWLPETFRKERSLAWRLAMSRARQHAKEDALKLSQAITAAPASTKGGKMAFVIPSPSALERSAPAPGMSGGTALGRIITSLSMKGADDGIKIHFRDVNPLAAIGVVLRQRHNFFAVLYSSLLFASQYSISFTAARTFAAPPYNYGSLEIGLVLLSFGVGNIIGSVGGGKYSDKVFNRLKRENGGVGEPEMRIKSTFIALALMPPFFITYAWVVEKQVPVYWPIMTLFVLGLATIWIYASTLAYIVDANPGRSSSAVACNSLFRGGMAAAFSQAAGPIIDAIGNGWYYTGFAFILLAGECLLLLVSSRGERWRAGYREAERIASLSKE